MRLGPIIYDLRRGVLRKSVIIILALFVVGGAGIAYLTYQLAAASIFHGLFYAHFTLSPEGQLKGAGILADTSLREIEGSLVYRVVCRDGKDVWKYEGSAKVRGVFTVEASVRDMPQWVHGPEAQCMLDISLTTPHGFYVVTSPANRWDDGTVWAVSQPAGPFVRSSIYNGTIGNAARSGELSVLAIKSGAEVKLLTALITQGNASLSVYVMEVQEQRELPSPIIIREDPESGGFRKVGTVGTGISLVSFKLANESTKLLALLFIGNGTFAEPVLSPLLESGTSLLAQQITTMMVQQLSSLFNFLFPIVALYLAYVYVAKPRAQGALEFLIARPITRLDIFVTRYVAGALVLALASLLFIASLNAAIYAIFSTPIEGYVLMLLLGGTIASLIAFYSLCYFISTVAKGGSYLALTIFLYLFFTIIINIVVSILVFAMALGSVSTYEDILTAQGRLVAISWLLNPLGASSIAQFFVTTYYGVEAGYMQAYMRVAREVLQPWAISVSIIGWIAIPVALGWLRFRKINLSQ